MVSSRISVKGYEHLFMGKSMYVAAYIRVSDPGKKDSDTLESQLDEIKVYCDQRGYILEEVYIYADAHTAYLEDYSKRPELMHLLNDAKKKYFSKVIIHKFARLARKSEEQTVLIYKLKEMGVEIESVHEHYEQSPVGNVLRALDSYNAEIERNQIVERVTRGRRKRATSGKLLGQGYTTYGYSWGANKATYVINDTVFYVDAQGVEWSEKSVVEYIFQELKHGVSLRKIAIELTRRGVPTKRGKPIWVVSTVQNIASNEFYIGIAYAFKWERHGVHNRTARPKEEWVKLPEHTIPRIIDDATFKYVQEQLVRNKQNAFRRNKYPTETLLRNGFIVCGVCKRVLRVMNFMQKMADGSEVLKSYYRCERDTGSTDPLYNHFIAANVAEADRVAWNFAQSIIRNPQAVEAEIAEIRREFKARDDLEAIQNSLIEVKRKIGNLLLTAQDSTDEDTITMARVSLSNLEREKRGLQMLLSEVTEEHDVYASVQAEVDKFVSWCNDHRPLLDDPTFVPTYIEKRTAIQILGVRVTAYPLKGDYEDRYTVGTYPPGIRHALTVNGLLKNSQVTLVFAS